MLLLLVALARLLTAAAHEVVEPTDADLDAVGAIIDRQPWTFPFLAFLRDKAVLFDNERQGFVMYRVKGAPGSRSAIRSVRRTGCPI